MYQYIFLILAQSHWRVVRIIFLNNQNSIDILWDDPYGGTCFPQILKDKISNVISEIFMFFRHVDVSISEVTKSIDQQGLGFNSWDCGPIALQNVENYLSNYNLQNCYVDNYLYINNHHNSKEWVLSVRKKHIIISMGDSYNNQEIIFENSQEVCNVNPENAQSSENSNLVTIDNHITLPGANFSNVIRSYHNEWWLATLNVRSLGNRKIKVNDNKFYNLPEYWNFFRQNNFYIIAIQETRVLGKCEQKGKEFITFFSGGEGKAEYGVGISVVNKWMDKIIHTELVNDRIMWLVINLGTNSKFCIFSVYGPPEESSNNNKIKCMSA